MDSGHSDSPGLVDSIRNLGEGLLASVQDRIALFSLELDEEKFRLIQVFFWISAIAFAGAMALTFASLALVYLFWESARLAVLGGLALVYATAFVSIVVAFRRFLRRQPMMLAGTLQEIREDRECIRTRN
jgi:uncharacterized membrane protein YqjE